MKLLSKNKNEICVWTWKDARDVNRKKCKYQNNERSMCLSMLKDKNHIRTAVCVSMCVNAHSKKAVKIYPKC